MAVSHHNSHDEITVHSDEEEQHQDETPKFFTEKNGEDRVRTKPFKRNGSDHSAAAPNETDATTTRPDDPVVPASPRRPREQGAALDGGWGWCVVFGCAYMHFLFGGFERSFGVVFVQLTERFATSATLTAAIGGGFTALRFGLAPVVCAINGYYSARTVTAVGAVIFSLGCFFCSLATSPNILFFTYSILCGVGSSLVYFPAMVLIGQYFDRRKGIAMGLATAGAGLGTFITPPIYQRAFDTYGFRGAFALMSSVLLNLLACSLLYLPVRYRVSPPTLVNAPASLLNKGEENADVEDGNERQPLISNRQRRMSQSRSNEITRIPMSYRRLVSTPVFICYVVTQALGTLSYTSAQALIVAHSMRVDEHLAADKAVYILSIIGIADLVGRILSGFIYDVSRVRRVRPYAYVVILLCLSASLAGWAFCTTFVQFSAVAAVNGLFTGAMVTGRAILVADVVGNENMPNAFGLTNFGQGIGVLVGPYIAGSIRDATGSYCFSYVFLSACCLVGAIVFFLGYHFKRRVEPLRDN